MWMKSTSITTSLEIAENGPISRSFLSSRLTGRKSEDCYTFEHFAARARVIHTAYYYHYKRNRFSLKEETRWS